MCCQVRHLTNKVLGDEQRVLIFNKVSLVETPSPLKPRVLELIATLFNIFREKKATGIKDGFTKPVVDEYMQRKKDRFKFEEVEEEYNRLIKVGLVQP